MTLDEALAEAPVVAIIRGVRPDEAVAIGEALYEGGIRVVEVPLNSPEPLASIGALKSHFADRMVCGAGTVLSPDQADAVARVGGEIVVSPNTNPEVIRRSLELGLVPMPGFATPTDAFMAYAAGARRLKLFPAGTYGVGHLKQLKAVLPKDAQVYAVGGVGAEHAADWLSAGIDGFGVGSELYRAGQSPGETLDKARALLSAVRG